MKRRLLKHLRLILQGAVPACAERGVSVHLVNGGRHPKLVLQGNGTRRVQPLSATPHSVESAVHTSLHEVRRILKEMTDDRAPTFPAPRTAMREARAR